MRSIHLEDNSYGSLLMNEQRFIAVPSQGHHDIKVGDMLNLFDGPGRAIKRVVTHIRTRDVLLSGDEKEMFISLRPLTNIEKDSIKNEQR